MNDFLLASNNADMLETIKKKLGKKYSIKDLGKVKIIIDWQIPCNLSTQILKINQSFFICNLVIKKSLTNCNSNIIFMKAGSAIEMIKYNNYKNIKIKLYQHLISKLLYLACGTRPDIAFIVDFLSRHNTDLKKNHLQAAKRGI